MKKHDELLNVQIKEVTSCKSVKTNQKQRIDELCEISQYYFF